MIRPFACLNRFALPLALVALCSLGSSTLLAETGDAHTHSLPASAITAQAARESASARTLELLTLHKQWLKAPANERAALHRQLLGKVEQRRQLLDELMQSHPAEVLRVAIPEEQQQGMPAAVLEFLEQKLELEGELEVVYEDYEDGTHKLRQFLKTPFGERFELNFAGKSPQHQSGTEVRIHGLLLEGVAQEQSLAGTLALESADSSVETLACCTDTGSTSSTSAPELPYTLGEQKTLAILVNFQDKPSERTTGLVTVNDWHNQIFGEVNDFYRENSDGKTWLSGDTVGWFTIPQNSTSCDQWGIASDAQAAASNAGVDLSAYNRFVFVFPWNSACGWGGQGSVGGASTYAWINGQPGLQTTAHELGHNLGLGHSEFLDCDVSPLGDSCSRMQYGDYLDVMGGSPSGHFNGFQKERLGWLPASGIQEIETGGNYVVDSYIGSATGKPKVLKILKGVDAQTGAKSWYYLESRQAKGFDSFVADSNYVITANVLNGVVIHQATEGVYNSSRLLDMTPGSSRLDDMKDPALETGYSFSDPDAGASITTMWVDSVQAQLSVDIGAQPCSTSVPSMEITPGQSDWVAAGTTKTYSVTVTSNDSATCSSTRVSLSASVPSGWSKALSNNAFDLAAGEAVTVSLDVTSSSSAVDGFYDITLTASSSAGNSSASATYIVSNSLANAVPTASNDSATTDEDTAVSVPVLANDSDPDGDALSIMTFSQGSNGAVTFSNSGTLTYTPKSGFSGTDSFSYTVSDGKGGTDNAVVNITVNAVIGNSAPVALDDSAATTKGSSVTIRVLSNDTDPDGDQLSLASVTQGAKGSVTLNGDGTLTYTPGNSFRDGDSFSYVISDGTATAAATVNISLAQQSSVDSGKGGGGTKGGGKPQ